ncbi:M48 family metallopeptidase [bacterium]|nr:M48 family metallopeptidase [bacterium]
MEVKQFKIGQNIYDIKLKRRKYAKYIRLSMEPDGSLVLTAAKTYPLFLIRRFLASRQKWILKHLDDVKLRPSIFATKHSIAEINKYKKQTRQLVTERLEYFNQFYNLKYNRIAIRNQKSRWGSCSAKKNLNFNYRLCLLAPELSDCVIVHELCHLKEMNHSVRFWKLVSQTIPNYKIFEKRLKDI